MLTHANASPADIKADARGATADGSLSTREQRLYSNMSNTCGQRPSSKLQRAANLPGTSVLTLSVASHGSLVLRKPTYLLHCHHSLSGPTRSLAPSPSFLIPPSLSLTVTQHQHHLPLILSRKLHTTREPSIPCAHNLNATSRPPSDQIEEGLRNDIARDDRANIVGEQDADEAAKEGAEPRAELGAQQLVERPERVERKLEPASRLRQSRIGVGCRASLACGQICERNRGGP